MRGRGRRHRQEELAHAQDGERAIRSLSARSCTEQEGTFSIVNQ